MNEEQFKLRIELYWVYANILDPVGEWDKEIIKERLNTLRFPKKEEDV